MSICTERAPHVKLATHRKDDELYIYLTLASGRHASMTLPRNMTDRELKEVTVTIALEAHTDRHASGECEAAAG